MKAFLILLALCVAPIFATPVGNSHRQQLLSDDDTFSDVVSPGDLIRATVDTAGYKKALNAEKDKVKLASRFTFVNDDNDFKPDVAAMVASGGIVMPKNTRGRRKSAGRSQQEYGRFFQGDMMLTKDQREHFVGKDGVYLPSRTGIVDERYRWDKTNGVVNIPYLFNTASKYTTQEKMEILYAMEYIQDYTCINFKPRTQEQDFIVIYSGEGCSSYVGKVDGQQLVSLKKSGCLRTGTILHELIHAIGYDHMQNHAERDNHVTIVWDNIKDSQADNFVKVESDLFSNFDTPYDYYSVMHYDSFAFSKNRKRTIVTNEDEYRDVIGQREGLSYGDIERINNMYQCERK